MIQSSWIRTWLKDWVINLNHEIVQFGSTISSLQVRCETINQFSAGPEKGTANIN